MLLIETDLYRVLYPEVIAAIKRDDNELVANALKDAEDEAKAYLSRFDLVALFGTNNSVPAVPSSFLKNKTVDIAAWFIARKANPDVNLEIIRTSYEDAIKVLEKIMMGKADPEGWPLKPENVSTGTNPGATITYSSNPKRSNYF